MGLMGGTSEADVELLGTLRAMAVDEEHRKGRSTDSVEVCVV